MVPTLDAYSYCCRIPIANPYNLLEIKWVLDYHKY